MKRIIACMLLLFVLAGCVQQTQEEEAKEGTRETGEVQIQQTTSTTLSSDIKNAIDEQLLPGVRSVMPINYRKLSYGDTFVFGIGVQSILNYEDIFMIKVTFNKAYDRYMNSIETDEETMNGWIKSANEEFTLNTGDKKTVPIVVEIGNMRPGTKPIAGTYVFSVETLNKEGGYYTNKEYSGKRDLSIKIE